MKFGLVVIMQHRGDPMLYYKKEVKMTKTFIYRLKDGINEAMMSVRDGYNDLAYDELEKLLDFLNKELENVK